VGGGKHAPKMSSKEGRSYFAEGWFFSLLISRMTTTSLGADACTYQEKLRRSVGPGMYMLNMPANDCGLDCKQDVPADPYLRFQGWGPNTCAPGAAVDDGSELRGLRYKASKCSADAYMPGKYPQKGACTVPGTAEARACAAPTEATRLSNPPCTLRSTGWNRWEWLCYDPQERAMIPFEWNVSYRTVVKDNHTPILEEPLDQSVFFPPAANTPSKVNMGASGWVPPAGCGAQAPGNPFGASFRSAAELQKM
jgi:hypothetical protein